MLILALLPVLHADPLTLEAAVAAARVHAPEAAILNAKAEQAHGDAGVARSSLLPQINAGGQLIHNDQEVTIPNFADPTQTLVIQKQDVVNANITASQLLFSGGALGRTLVTHHQVEAAEATRAGAQLDLDLRVANLWLGARSAGELREATQEALGDATAHRVVAEQQVNAGTATPLTLERAKFAELDAKQHLLDAQRTEADLLGQLGLLVGADDTIELAPMSIPDADAAADASALGDAALSRRPELLAARATVDAAHSGRWVIVGEWAPTLSAVGQLKYTNSPLLTTETTSWYVGLSATLPVFDGGLRFADARRGNAQITQAEESLRRQEESTREEVRAAVRAASSAHEALGVAKAQEEIALSARGMAEASFNAGASTSLDVEDAQASVLTARVNRIRAESSLLTAQWQLKRLVGEGM